MVAVLGLFAVAIILTTLIASSVVSGLGWSTSTRASVESHAAADAGIVAARTGLFTVGNCQTQSTSGKYVSTTSPVYTVTVERNDGAGWVMGCPTSKTSQVRITSTGTAIAKGVAGVSSGDVTKVQAVLQFLQPGVDPSGVAIYVNGNFSIGPNSSFDLSEGGNTGLIVKNGTFVCDKNNSVINGSIVVLGDLTFINKCNVTGNAKVTGSATLGVGRIDGDLTAGSVSPADPKATNQVGGIYTQSAVVPPSPDWVNLTYKPGDWLTSDGTPFEVRDMTTTGGCMLTSGNLGAAAASGSLILNALGCPDGPTINQNTNIKLTSDVVIFANKYTWPSSNSLTFSSSSTAGHRLWLITPDNGPAGDNAPTCDPVTQGNWEIKNSVTIAAPISAMLYTPCGFSAKNNFVWNGQIYAGGPSDAMNNPKFTFVPMGAAGVDFDTSTPTTIITKPQPGAVVIQRELSLG
jgi:hypothetical protein